MYSFISIITLLLKSILVGFSFVMPVVCLLKTSNLKLIRNRDLFILVSVKLLRFVGILYFVFIVKDLFIEYFDQTSYLQTNTSYEVYIYYTLYTPLLYLILSQLLWFKKMYMNKVALAVLSMLMIILSSQMFLTVMSNLFSSHNDYLPSSWRMYVLGFNINPIVEIALNIIVYIFITFTIILMGGKLKDKKA